MNLENNKTHAILRGKIVKAGGVLDEMGHWQDARPLKIMNSLQRG